MRRGVLPINSVYGEWTIIGEPETRNSHRYYPSRCSCRTVKYVLGTSLHKGRSSSCGCKRTEYFIEAQKKERLTNRDGAPLKAIPIKQDRIQHLYEVRYRHSIRDRKTFSGSDLTFSEWKELVDAPCFYCGDTGSNKQKDFSSGNALVSDTEIHINGIDRVDSTLPYSLGNVVSCCKHCNRMKGGMTQMDFVNHIKKICAHGCD